MTARMYIWPRYALEVDGTRAEFSDTAGPMVARLFRSLGCFVRTDELIEAAYGDDPEGGPLAAHNCVSHIIGRANVRLRRIGAEITSQRGLSARRLVIGDAPEPFVFTVQDLVQMPPPPTASRGAWRYLAETAWRDHHFQ